MTGPDRERLRRLFEDACDLETRDQRSFLDEQCAGDSELYARLVALLNLDTDEHEVLPESDVMAGFLFHAEAGHVAGQGEESAGGELSEGVRIGHYTILGTLGAGGMGTVYEARQDSPSRIVALKMLNPGLTSRHLTERFQLEGRILGRLNHIGIGRIFESGALEVNGAKLPFYSMERIDGLAVTSHVSSHSVDRRGVLELIAKVCDGLQHAHDKGVIHRDLKPDNILVDKSGQPKILDFGVARILNTETWISTLHTQPGQLIGTLPYMSPEQVSGLPDAVNHRSDLYAVGVLLYRLLTGRLPHDLRELSIPQATRVIQDEEPTRLRFIDKSLRGNLETIVERCLAKEPARRYASAGDLASDLRRHLDQLPIGAKPITTFDHWIRFARRHKGLVGGVVVAFLSLVIGLSASLWQMNSALHANEVSRREAYRSKISASAAAFDLGNVLTAREVLEEVDDDLREWEWHYYYSKLDQNLAEFDMANVMDVTFDPLGSSYWAFTRDGVLSQVSLPGHEVLRRFELPAQVPTNAVFSRDASTLVVQDEASSMLEFFEVATGQLKASLPLEPNEGARIALDPKGMRAARPEDGVVRVLEPGRPDRVLDAGKGQVTSRSLIALNGDLLVVARRYGDVISFDLGMEDGGKREFRGTSKAQPRSIAIDARGERVAVGALDMRVRLFDVAAGESIAEFAGHTEPPHSMAFSADSKTLFSGSNDLTIRLWDLESGLTRGVLSGHRERIGSIRLSPSGQHMLTEDGADSLLYWRVQGPDDLAILTGHGSYVYPVAFSPTADVIASGGWDKTVRIWDSASSAELSCTRLNFRVAQLAFSPSGQRIGVLGQAPMTVVLETTGSQAPLEVQCPAVRGRALVWMSEELLWLAGSARADGEPNLILCDVEDQRVVRSARIPGGTIFSMALSEDRASLAVGGQDSRIRVLNAETLAVIGELEGHAASVLDLAFDPSGKKLISGSEDASARLWDLETLECVRVLLPHRGLVRGVAFSRDGRRIATACADTLVRLFDTQTGERVATFNGHRDYVYAIDFSSRDDLLASSSGDGTIRLWDPHPIRERYAARYLDLDD